MIELNVKIVGHELKQRKEKLEGGSVHEYDMLHVKMRGIGEDKTALTLELDPEAVVNYPLGDVCTATFEVRQTRLDLQSGSSIASASITIDGKTETFDGGLQAAVNS